MRGARRAVLAACGVVGWWLVSCREVQTPEEGILSLSPVRLPSPGLVQGDTMRDSLGLVAPLRVVGYGVAGDSLANVAATFVALDTGAHLDGALLIGDKAGTTVRVIGSVAAIQTQPASVKVTLSPDTLMAADSVIHHRTYALITGDTVVNAELRTSVLHRSGATTSGVVAVVVRYLIESAPTGINNEPTVVLLIPSTNVPSNRDTTDASGASRTARLRLLAMNTFTTDTALISATASYAGRQIGRVLFTLIFTNTTPTP